MTSYNKKNLIEGKYTVQKLLDTANDVVKKKTAGSIVLDVEAENRIPKFQEAGTFGWSWQETVDSFLCGILQCCFAQSSHVYSFFSHHRT